MKYVLLNSHVAVGDSPGGDEDVRQLAEQEFHSILNLRAQGENAAYSSRREGIQAQEAGLIYLNFPMEDGRLEHGQIEAFRSKLALLPAPTYVHAADTHRAALLALIDHAVAREWSADRAVDFAHEIGLPCGGAWENSVREFLEPSEDE